MILTILTLKVNRSHALTKKRENTVSQGMKFQVDFPKERYSMCFEEIDSKQNIQKFSIPNKIPFKVIPC